MDFTNKVFKEDNLKLMKKIPPECVDLIYIDPPFMTQRVFKEKAGAFNDKFDGIDDFLAFISPRLIECRRVLKSTGSLMVHLDWHTVHYVKCFLDKVFGYGNFKNEIIWQRKNTSTCTGIPIRFPRNNDSILYYSKSSKSTFKAGFTQTSQSYKSTFTLNDNDGRGFYKKDSLRAPSLSPTLRYTYKGYKPHSNGWSYTLKNMVRLDNDNMLCFPSNKKGRICKKSYLSRLKGVQLKNIWIDIPLVRISSKEGLNYPTQKPERLLERIIRSCSNKGDLVADFFCGSGTTLAVAKKNGRNYLGCDVSDDAVELTEKRLKGITLITSS